MEQEGETTPKEADCCDGALAGDGGDGRRESDDASAEPVVAIAVLDEAREGPAACKADAVLTPAGAAVPPTVFRAVWDDNNK